jgi:hypothetical protein
MSLDVALDSAYATGPTNLIESQIREEYLQLALEQQDLISELSTPPD